jgi:hypothetical protein
MQVIGVGERARAALVRSGGLATPLAGFADAPYLEADGEIIWVGSRLPARHPRAVLTAAAPRRGVALRFGALPARGWSPRPAAACASAGRARRATRALRRDLLHAAAPRGFGLLLAGAEPPFPLDLARSRVDTLAEAYRGGDPVLVLRASLPLLGTGAGLTPSGDDLTGAALFGRLLVGPRDRVWVALAAQLAREVALRSHAISAALFADLARGRSFGPLHALAAALEHGRRGAALEAARRLVALGHSSGWDMLTGFMLGMGIALSE